MAESRSDDSCDAPKDFQLSSTEGSESRFSATHRKCFLCFHFRKVFYCKQCIRNGDFVHSTSHFSERYADKQLRLIRTKANCKAAEESCEALLSKRLKKDNVLLEINRCKEKIELLKLAIQQKKDNGINNAAKLKYLKDHNTQLSTKFPRYKDKLQKVCKLVHHQKAIIERHNSHIELEQESLQVLRRQRLKQLVDFVFPIKEIQNLHSTGLGSAGCTERALAEASRPTEAHQALASLQILSALLPIDIADYSAYCHWVTAKCLVNKQMPGGGAQLAAPEPVKQNPAYRISAALAYSAQMLQIMAFYLDVRLPFNITYNDLCSCELEERRFKRRVWRLQGCAAAVAAGAGLGCVGQGVGTGPGVEPPLHVLLRACPLQLTGIHCEDLYQRQQAQWLEREWWGWGGTGEGWAGAGSDDDEPEPPEHLQWDWETLGDANQANIRTPQSATTSVPVAAGLVTSAAASIVSMWRGWTTK